MQIIEGWVREVIEFHKRDKDPELKKINDKWCGYCGCEGGCALCSPYWYKKAKEILENYETN